MEIGILGPLVLSHADRVAAPTAPKPRSVLGLLLLNGDQIVQSSVLIRDLWGASPPASAATTLQTYILQVRKCLSRLVCMSVSEVAEKLLITANGGYALLTDSIDFDRRTFDRLAAAGRRALAAGDNAEAAELLSSACYLWRGAPLSDVHAGVITGPQIRALEQTRLTTLEQRIDAHMRLGHHQDVLPDLTLLMAEHELNENLCAQLMVALHRSGRRREALSTFQQLRTSMIEELGLEPSKRMHLLQQAILSDDPVLEVAPREDGLTQLLDRIVPRRVRA
jgi:SARP family transcriptional regulator, regulator of embCAB operon